MCLHQAHHFMYKITARIDATHVLIVRSKEKLNEHPMVHSKHINNSKQMLWTWKFYKLKTQKTTSNMKLVRQSLSHVEKLRGKICPIDSWNALRDKFNIYSFVASTKWSMGHSSERNLLSNEIFISSCGNSDGSRNSFLRYLRLHWSSCKTQFNIIDCFKKTSVNKIVCLKVKFSESSCHQCQRISRFMFSFKKFVHLRTYMKKICQLFEVFVQLIFFVLKRKCS